jgi:hypothetical protein
MGKPMTGGIDTMEPVIYPQRNKAASGSDNWGS